MAVRFRNEFYSHLGEKWTVEIDDSEFSGDVFEFVSASTDFECNWQGENDDVNATSLPSQATLTFMLENPTHHNMLNDMAEAAEGRFTLGIYRGETPELWWAGTIIPDVSSVDDIDFPQSFKITAVDGLGMLAKIPFLDDAEPFDGLEKMISIINVCLYRINHVPLYFTGADPYIVTCVNTYDTTDTITATSDPLFTKSVDQQAFYKFDTNGGFEPKNCLEVIDAILAPFMARIYLSNGKWHIEQRESRAFEEDSYWRKYNFSVASPSAYTPEANLSGNPTRQRITGGTYGWRSPLNKVVVTQYIGGLRNLLDGLTFDDTDTTARVLTVYCDGEDSTMRLDGSVDWKITNLGVPSTPVPLYLAPHFIIWKFRIKIGDRWLRRSESIQNNASVASVTKWSPIAADYEFATKVIHPFVEIGESTSDVTTFEGTIVGLHSSQVGGQTMEISFQSARFVRALNSGSETVDPGDYEIEFKILDPYLTIVGEPPTKAEKFYKESKTFEAQNPNTGNSDVLKVDLIVGDALELNQVGAIRYWDGSEYQATTDWGQREAGGSGTLAELVAKRYMAARTTPSRTLSVTVTGPDAFKIPHVLRTESTYTYYFRGGTFRAAMDEFDAVWEDLVYSDEEAVIYNPPYEPGTYERQGPGRPGLNTTPGGRQSVNIPSMFATAAGLNAIGYTSTALAEGAITLIEINESLAEQAIVTGQRLYVVNPASGESVSVTVTADVAVGDTEIEVTGTIPEDGFPMNSFVIYDPWNDFSEDSPTGGPSGGSGTVTSFSAGNLSPLFTTSVATATTTPALSFLLTDAGATTYFGAISAGPPSFITGGAISKVDDTNVTLSLGGNFGKALLQSASLTLGWAGVLAISRGGTNNGTPGSAGQLVRMNATADAYEYFTATYLTGNQTITISGAVSGSGATAISVSINNNVVTDAALRDSAGLSVIGRATNTTGDPADIVAGTDAHVLRRAGTSLGFGQVATGGIADDAVTNAKLANMPQNTVKGRVSSGTGDPEDLTASQLATLLGYTGTATRILYWGASNTIASDGNFTRDATNNRVTITGTVAATGANNAWLNLNAGSISGNAEALRLSATILGELIAHITNASNTSTAASVMRLTVGGTSAADPFLHLVVTSGNQVAIGIDNSDADKFKISPGSATPGATANKGVIITQDAATRVGINNDAPSYELDVFGTTRTQVLAGRVGTPSISYGTGAGTGPTTNFCTGGSVTVSLSFTTGTSPAAAGADIFTITIPYAAPLDCGPAWGVRNANAAGIRWYCPTSGTSTFTIRALDTLAASTNYQMKFIIASPTGA